MGTFRAQEYISLLNLGDVERFLLNLGTVERFLHMGDVERFA